MDSRQRVLKTLNHQIPDRVPVYEVLIDAPIVERLFGYKNTWSWSLSVDDMIRLHKLLELDSICVPLQSWRAPEMKDNKPNLKEVKEPSPSGIDASLERCESVVSRAHEEGLCVSAYLHGCFDVTYESLGFENFMYLLYDDLDYVDAVVEIFYQYHKKMAELAVSSGADYVLIGDDIAFKTGIFINPDMFHKLWYKRTMEMCQVVKRSGKPLEFHTDGRIEGVLHSLIEMGVDMVNPVEPYSNDIIALKKQYGGQIGFRGNMDMGGNLAFGTEEETYLEAKELILALKPGGNYVCSTCHSLSQNVKLENYQAMVRAVKEFGWY